MNPTPDDIPSPLLDYRSAPAAGALRREDLPAYYVGRWFRIAALVLCGPLLLWGVTRPLIVAYLDGNLRFALLLLVGLPTLGLCGLFWFVGLVLLVVTHRHNLRRDLILTLLPVGIGMLTLACVVVLPRLIVLTPPAVSRAGTSLTQNRPAWDAAAEKLRLSVPVLANRAYVGQSGDASPVAGMTVQKTAVDAAGGVWFQTDRSDAGGIWDYWFSGLVHRPGDVDPFGNRGKLTLTPLGDGWYAFRTRWSD